jgi:membrane-associated phospholipid phosphatase
LCRFEPVHITIRVRSWKAGAIRRILAEEVKMPVANRNKIAVFALCLMSANAQTPEKIEPEAGTWKTWVLQSGRELRLPTVPNAAQTSAEIVWLKQWMAQANNVALEQFRYWNAGSPPYRWIELFSDRLRKERLTVSIPSFRGYSLLATAMHDATVAAWDSKYVHNRPRPSEIDPQIKPLIEVPRSPSYPSEHAVVAGAAATVLGFLFPAEAQDFQYLAEEAARSRMTAGVQFPSDVLDGLEMGRAVGQKVIEYARTDKTDTPFTATIPTGDGYWTGSNPGFATSPSWKTWFLSRPDEFRPAPPPSHDSATRAAELAELRGLVPRTFAQNAGAFYWQTAEGVHTFWFDLIHRGLYETGLDENPPRAARAYALMAVAQFDSMIASNDAKTMYWVQRPSQADPNLATVFPNPNFASYPSNHSTLSGSRAEIIAYLFPHMADYARSKGEEAGLSRLWAGIHYRSDHTAGVAMGKAIAAKLIGIAENDGSNTQR